MLLCLPAEYVDLFDFPDRVDLALARGVVVAFLPDFTSGDRSACLILLYLSSFCVVVSGVWVTFRMDRLFFEVVVFLYRSNATLRVLAVFLMVGFLMAVFLMVGFLMVGFLSPDPDRTSGVFPLVITFLPAVLVTGMAAVLTMS